MCACFNPPPHGERPRTLTLLGKTQSAPPHGERHVAARHDHVWEGVSIRAPARGATIVSLLVVASSGFNPRPRTGSDRGQPAIVPRRNVSIRAPARGATALDELMPHFVQVSIRAPARGATCTARPASRGRWRFNPRPRTGSDNDGLDVPLGDSVSIRAPARGATVGSLNALKSHV